VSTAPLLACPRSQIYPLRFQRAKPDSTAEIIWRIFTGYGKQDNAVTTCGGGIGMLGDEAQLSTRISLLMRLGQEPIDEGAWSEFVDRYGPLMLAWCRQWGLQPADADDVSQNVLVKLVHHLRSFVYDPSRRFRGFLRTVAFNACNDYLDSKRRAVTATANKGVQAVLGSVQAREDLAARLQQAFDLERLEMAQARVRQRIEPHTWEAFRLTAREGKSGEEAASLLGMQVGTVFKAKSKVQKMLRDEIERLEREEPPWMPARVVPNSKSS
jgi:RNA polymerase sigma-70 factor (ECF subfamily)